MTARPSGVAVPSRAVAVTCRGVIVTCRGAIVPGRATGRRENGLAQASSVTGAVSPSTLASRTRPTSSVHTMVSAHSAHT